MACNCLLISLEDSNLQLFFVQSTSTWGSLPRKASSKMRSCCFSEILESLDVFNSEATSNGNFKGPLKYLLMPLLGKNQLAITLHMYASIGPNLDNTHRGQILSSSWRHRTTPNVT